MFHRSYISTLYRQRKSKIIREEDRRKAEREASDKAWAESEIERLSLSCSYIDFEIYEIMRDFENMFTDETGYFRSYYQLIEEGELPELAGRELIHDSDFRKGFQEYTEKLDREEFEKWVLYEKIHAADLKAGRIYISKDYLQPTPCPVRLKYLLKGEEKDGQQSKKHNGKNGEEN
jgi:hypothetical protein